MPLDRAGGGVSAGLRRPKPKPKPKPTAKPQHPFAGAGQTSPKPRPRPRTQTPFMDPYARAAAEILPGYSRSAQALQQALMGQAGYEIGRVRNRQAWQQGILSPFEQSARDIGSAQSSAVSGLGEALQAAQRQLGYGLQGDIGQKLADIQAPGASQAALAGVQGQTGEGAAGAIGGLSAAEAEALNAIGNAYGGAAAALPGIAGLAGDAAARDIARTAANQYAVETAQREAQLQRDLLEGQRYWSEFDYRRQQDAAQAQAAALEFAAEREQTAYDRQQDQQNMAYKWATLGVREKSALLADRRTAQRIFLEQKRIGLTAQNQTFNQWYKQQSLGLRAQSNAISQGYLGLAYDKAGRPIIRGAPSTGVGIYDPETGQQIGGYPGTGSQGKGKPKPLGTPRQLAQWRAYARATVAGALEQGDGLADVIGALESDTDAGPMAVWGPVVAARFGLTRNLPNNLKKYPPIRILQLARKLGMPIEFANDQAPSKQQVAQAIGWLGEQWRKLYPKAPAASSGAPRGTANVAPNAVQASNILPASFKVTHRTTGAEQYGATDWFRPAGTVFGAPVGGTIYNIHGTPGSRGNGIYGYIAYLKGDNGVTYFLTHFDKVFVRDGQRVQRGTPIGTVAPYGNASHIHIGSSAV